MRRSFLVLTATASVSLLSTLVTVAAPSAALAQQTPPSSGVFIQQSPPTTRMYPSEGTLEFERTRLDYAPQSVGTENCVNLPLNNTTDHPRLLTKLISRDPEHFYISSPSDAMLPLTIGGNSSLYINICFKADQIKSYKSELLAIFQSDTVVLGLTGTGIKKPVAEPLPKESTIRSVEQKKHEWTIELALAQQGIIRLALENSLGKTVRNFPFDDTKSPGIYRVTFDEKGDDGKKLEKGSYVLRMEVVDASNHQKLHASRRITIK